MLTVQRAAYSRNTQGALADTDQVVYNGHGRRPSDQYAPSSSRPRCVPRPGCLRTPYAEALSVRHIPLGAIRHSAGASSREEQPCPRPVISMNHCSSSSYAQLPPPPTSSSRRPVAQPRPSYPGGRSFMPPPPVTPMYMPLPLHNHTPMAGRFFTPVTLPPCKPGT